MSGATCIKWISVKEKLPEECDFILTFCGSLEMCSCRYKSPYWNENDITHWTYLPEPPEGAI